MFFHQLEQSKVFLEFPCFLADPFLETIDIALPYRFDHIIFLIFSYDTIPNFRPAQVFLLTQVDNELIDVFGPFLGLSDQSLISPDAVSFTAILNSLSNLFPCFPLFPQINEFFIFLLCPYLPSFGVIYFSKFFFQHLFKRFILL